MSRSKAAARDANEEAHKAKRRKLDHKDVQRSQEEIPHSLRDLQWGLTFQQDSPTDLRNGTRSFKSLLDSILYDDQNADKTKQWSILKSYCEGQSTRDEDGHVTSPFPDIVQTWSFAEQSNNESLLSSVPAILALFLKTVSSELSYRDFGISLCKLLLQKEQLRLINRGLMAPKSKEHLISPCIRLLTEIASFDGGAVSNALYARRDTTFNRLEIFLGMRKESYGDLEEDRRKPSVRTNAVRYLLANLRFQTTTAKVDILNQGKTWKMCLDDLRADPRDLVVDILSYLDIYVLKDAHVARQNKGRFLNQLNLPKLATLFGYKKDFGLNDGEKPVSEMVKSFLLSACTDPSNGVLAPQTGWYPVGSHPDATEFSEEEGNLIDLGLDSPSCTDSYGEKIPVRNATLSYFIQGLRPEMDTLQMGLLLAIFEAAPELVADYFSKKTKFVSQPKETPAWLGQSAFLFSTVQLPVPKYCGWKDGLPLMPPPTSVVIESVLPRPLTQEVVTRCLNQSSDIITLYGLRVTRRSLQKLAQILEEYRSAQNQRSSVWAQASSRLVAEFCRRCPNMKDVISTFRSTPKENYLQREAVLETLVLFYQVLPQVALEEKFDVSLALVDLLESITSLAKVGEERESLLMELNYILEIARNSPSVRWWQKPELLSLSPFTTVLRVLTETLRDPNLRLSRTLIEAIILENGIVSDLKLSIEAFFASLQQSESWAPRQATFDFVDNCLVRLTQKPVHYLDFVHGLQTTFNSASVVSLLVAVTAEQWPFVVKAESGDEENVAGWIARYLGYLQQAGEDVDVLLLVRNQILEAASKKKSRSALKKAFKPGHLQNLAAWSFEDVQMTDLPMKPKMEEKIFHPSLQDVFGPVPKDVTSHNTLMKWAKQDDEESVLQGSVGELMMGFCSELGEIRNSAYVNAKNLMSHLDQSTYAEAKPIYLLIGEVTETAKDLQFPQLPNIFGELAARSVMILANPLHKVYGKVNKYLNKGPKWDVGKIPSYWIDRILLREPEHDDGHLVEINWLLDLLISGLRTGEDMELYRQCNVFERCLSFYESPGIGREIKMKILHLVYRASEAGGSTTLITRAGIMDWIKVQVALKDGHDVILRQLMRHLFDSCDRDRVEKWGGQSVVEAVEQMKLE